MPRNVAKSGTASTWLQNVIERDADADAEQGDANREAHGQHRSERQDQDDDGERQPDDLRGRLFELTEDEAAELDLHTVERRLLVADLLADLARAGS